MYHRPTVTPSVLMGWMPARRTRSCFTTDHLIEVVVVQNGRIYVIDYLSKAPLTESDRATMDRLLASFRFEAAAAS